MNKYFLWSAMLVFSSMVSAVPVNINTADAQTIAASLSGIGLKKAEAIVADRNKNGAFKSVEDLQRVLGIGEKTISANKTDILIETPQVIAPKAAVPVVNPTVRK